MSKTPNRLNLFSCENQNGNRDFFYTEIIAKKVHEILDPIHKHPDKGIDEIISSFKIAQKGIFSLKKAIEQDINVLIQEEAKQALGCYYLLLKWILEFVSKNNIHTSKVKKQLVFHINSLLNTIENILQSREKILWRN